MVDSSTDEIIGETRLRGVEGRDPFWKSVSKYLLPWETGQMTMVAMICLGTYLDNLSTEVDYVMQAMVA